MTVTLPPDKLSEIMCLVDCWGHKSTANIYDLRSLLGKLLFVAQCCPQSCLFTNRMLETLQACPLQGVVHLSPEFKKDLAWFHQYLPCTNGVFLIHEESRTPIPLFVDACTSGCGAVTSDQAYHRVFPPQILHQNLPICHLEALNAVVALKVWAHMFSGHLVHLFSVNTTSVAIFQVGRSRDAFIQACTRGIWLTCATWDITLAVGHISGASLEGTADALSRWHLGQPYQARVDRLLATHAISCISVHCEFFHLCQEF